MFTFNMMSHEPTLCKTSKFLMKRNQLSDVFLTVGNTAGCLLYLCMWYVLKQLQVKRDIAVFCKSKLQNTTISHCKFNLDIQVETKHILLRNTLFSCK